MTHAVDGVRKTFAFFKFDSGACAVQLRENFAYMFVVWLRYFAHYDSVCEVKEGELHSNAEQDQVHCTVECTWCVEESEWYTCKAIETMIGSEFSLVPIRVINFDLKISVINV